jgi:hypothetical protein
LDRRHKCLLHPVVDEEFVELRAKAKSQRLVARG